MTRFKVLTLASAIATAFAVPTVLAQQTGMPNSQSGTPDSSSRIQQRDATGNPSGSPTQPPRSTTGANDPTLRSGSANRDRSTMGHGQYDSSTVRNVQQALQDKGYDVGPIDGVMGPRTQSALREFQQQQGLTRSGQLDQQTMSALDVQASASGRAGTMSDRSAAPGGDRSGAGSSGTSAAGGSPSAGGSGGTGSGPADRSGTMGDRSGSTSGTTPDRSGPTSGTTPDRSGTGSSGTSAIGGSPSPSGGATGSGGTTGGRSGG
jgi:peptidoglycan hydrolase-like protein with peptidoglycan-binding domain